MWRFECVAGPFAFTEGPVWTGAAVLFTDILTSRIMRYNPRSGACTEVAGDTNEACGLTRDRAGALYVCEGAGRRVARYTADGARVTLADSYAGKRLNAPNDVVVDSGG